MRFRHYYCLLLSIQGDLLEILFVDYQSTDSTISLIAQFLKSTPDFAKRVWVVKHQRNYGYGCSIKTGFSFFQKRNVSQVCVLHGDFQVDPAWLLDRLKSGFDTASKVDVVLASRFLAESEIG